MALSQSLMASLPADLKASLQTCLIHEHRLCIGSLIGSGNFGNVYVGILADENLPRQGYYVAIKTVKAGRTEELTKFLQEAISMKNFDHVNVLGLIGVVIKNNHPYAVLPYMDLGDLKKYVSNDNNRLTPNWAKHLMGFIQQVAKGMDYLAMLNFVHRDLAARNCLVDSAGLVKIADFGLTRDMDVQYYYRATNGELPWKWMALESLEPFIFGNTFRFDTKSDVWSFGVLMWETMSNGAEPYIGTGWWHVLEYLKNGNRLKQPQSCSDAFYAIMLKCWWVDPSQRPTFSQLDMEIDALLHPERYYGVPNIATGVSFTGFPV